MRLLVARALLAALALAGQSAQAQLLTRPARPWKTVTTEHFRFHFPAEMEGWVMPVATRMESYAAAVNALVGSAPEHQVTVMVEDPNNEPNGFAVPLLEGPVMFLWPTPPGPSPTFGMHRGWGEVLAVHEYAHLAHLTIPSRNAGQRLLWKLAPSRVGPVAINSPAWVIEGYATYVEGVLTGSGRPHSVGRAAVLRQWALEGSLPRYHELSNPAPFLGGAMRYLAGSAFLEWLAQRRGEESLKYLWRRMSAREVRSFPEAFRGVYGAAPDELYGAFYAEVMESAFAIRGELKRAGLVEGELIQRLQRGTGAPAVSPDGSMVAVVLRSATAPSRVVIWRTADETIDARTQERRKALLARDSLDVVPFDSFPPVKKAEATLRSRRGVGFDAPRWFADNERLLVVTDEPLGDGATRPDLFVWNRRSGRVKRLTSGAGIRSADPAPDGTWAAAARCANGICDLVRVETSTGATSTIVGGSPFVVWHRPRVSPDGQRIAAAVQRDGRWSVAIVNATTRDVRAISVGDNADRYTPAWTSDGRLIVVSERGGVPNLELLELDGRATTLTRVTGGVATPDVGSDGRIWFLNLHARGYDVRRIALRSALASSADRIVALDARLAPASPRPRENGRTFTEGRVEGPTDYGLGPRQWRVLAGGNYGPDGDLVSLMVANIDPAARFSNVLQWGVGERGAWNGGALSTALRSGRIRLAGDVWATRHRPSEQRAGSFASSDFDAKYRGLFGGASWSHEGGLLGVHARAGATLGKVDGNQLDAASRVATILDGRARLSLQLFGAELTPQLSAHLSKGETGGDSWQRKRLSATVNLGRAVRVEYHRGETDVADAGEFGRSYEQFAIGGVGVPFVDPAILSQRVALPAVPVGYVSGSKFELVKATARIAGVRSYVALVAAGDTIGHHKRVIGAEEEFSFASIGFVRMPSTFLRFGVGYSFDLPYKDKLRPYVSVNYRP